MVVQGLLGEEANKCPRSSETGHGVLWAKAVRTGFELEAETSPVKYQRKKWFLFWARHPSFSEHPQLLMRSMGWRVGAMGVQGVYPTTLDNPLCASTEFRTLG